MKIFFILYNKDKIYKRSWINSVASLNFGYILNEPRTKEERTNNEQ
jgi:hypothetical protein